jgi:two-component system OmpR family response regulator
VGARPRTGGWKEAAGGDRLTVRVLLVDDTPEIAELLTYSLRDQGFEVVATGFDPAINELVVEHRADALVFDCSLYQMSESLFDAVRNDPNHAALPVVIVSDTPEQADASLRRRDAEQVMLIPKPFTGKQIARALTELLDRRTTAAVDPAAS